LEILSVFRCTLGLALVLAGPSLRSQTTSTRDPQRKPDLIISPSGSVTIAAGSHQQFVANAVGVEGSTFAWEVHGTHCGEVDCGSISADGLYSAPERVPVPLEVRIQVRQSVKPFLAASEQVQVTLPVTAKRGSSCRSVQPGYCDPRWQAHQLVIPYVW
jgi:hypothetical protein